MVKLSAWQCIISTFYYFLNSHDRTSMSKSKHDMMIQAFEGSGLLLATTDRDRYFILRGCEDEPTGHSTTSHALFRKSASNNLYD